MVLEPYVRILRVGSFVRTEHMRGVVTDVLRHCLERGWTDNTYYRVRCLSPEEFVGKFDIISEREVKK